MVQVGLPLQPEQGIVAFVPPDIVTALALLAALLCAVLSARRAGLNYRFVYWAGVASLVYGLWGGHLLGILYNGTDGRPLYWLRFWDGGQVQYGALFGGALAFVGLLKLQRLNFLDYADAVAPAIALGVGIGRIACFLNGDDYGTLSSLPWAVRFPPGTEAYADHLSRGWITPSAASSLPVHPVQLYASLFWLALFAVLVLWHPRQHGARFAFLLVAHGSGRVVEQLFRGDMRRLVGPLSLTQILSLMICVAGIALWLLCARARRRDPAPVVEFIPMAARVQPLRDDKTKGLIGTTEVVP